MNSNRFLFVKKSLFYIVIILTVILSVKNTTVVKAAKTEGNKVSYDGKTKIGNYYFYYGSDNCIYFSKKINSNGQKLAPFSVQDRITVVGNTAYFCNTITEKKKNPVIYKKNLKSSASPSKLGAFKKKSSLKDSSSGCYYVGFYNNNAYFKVFKDQKAFTQYDFYEYNIKTNKSRKILSNLPFYDLYQYGNLVFFSNFREYSAYRTFSVLNLKTNTTSVIETRAGSIWKSGTDIYYEVFPNLSDSRSFNSERTLKKYSMKTGKSETVVYIPYKNVSDLKKSDKAVVFIARDGNRKILGYKKIVYKTKKLSSISKKEYNSFKDSKVN